ncbi:MAG: hypothetical protein P4L33_19480 [Capsulimonadaceae bacterium]|nr:hypothetical protein [Capsulimonadaceae bacterium]
MDIQSIVAALLVAAAAWYVGRAVWAQISGVVSAGDGKTAPCDACCGCAKDKSTLRPSAPVKLTTATNVALPPHIEAMRAARRAGMNGETIDR